MENQITINLQKLCENIVIVTSDVNNADEIKTEIENALKQLAKSNNEEATASAQETQE